VLKDCNVLADFENILVAILMDLLLYDNMEMVDEAFKLFNEMFSKKILLMNYLKNV
jgi:hypothetical protein